MLKLNRVIERIESEGMTVARINKSTLTKLEIIRVASRMFLEKGYTATTIKAISSELSPSSISCDITSR